MCHVDALSRNPVVTEVNLIDLTEADWITVAQAQDERITQIKTILEMKQSDGDTKKYFQDYLLKNGRVYKRLEKNKTAWLVPKSCRWQICRLCHDESGHFGVEKTLKRISENYWFPKMMRFVKKYVEACAPTRLVTDRGAAFTSQVFKEFCLSYGIKHILNAVSTPRANGQCERVNRTILNSLAVTAAGSPENKWDTFVKQVQSVINCTENKTAGVSPLEVLAGYKGRNIAEAKLLSVVQDNLEEIDLCKIRAEVEERISQGQQKQKERFDRNRLKAKVYKEGDIVMVLRTDFPATGTSRKLLSKFKVPFRIKKVLFNDRYAVEDLRENMKRYQTVVAVDKIKPWINLKGKLHERS